MIKLFCIVCFSIAVSGCGKESSVTVGAETDKGGLLIPHSIRSTDLPSEGELRAYVRINDGERYEMLFDPGRENVFLTINNLTKGEYRFTIEYLYDSTEYGEVLLATANILANLSEGNNQLEVDESFYEMDRHDDDNDGISNIAEFSAGTYTPPVIVPQGLMVEASELGLKLTWDSVDDAISYTVYLAEEAGVTKDNIDAMPGGAKHVVLSPSTSFLHVPDLSPGVSYYFVVTSTVAGRTESAESEEVHTKRQAPVVYSFAEQLGVPLEADVESEQIIVSGISEPVEISIIGGRFAINGGNYQTGLASVTNGDEVKVSLTASTTYSTTTEATLSIGNVDSVFSVTTEDDTKPSPFTLADHIDVALGSEITSEMITVTGITGATPIFITGGSYAINGGDYRSTMSSVLNGDVVTVRLTSPTTYSTTREATLTIGGVSATFSVTTEDDTTPGAFTLTEQTGVPLNTAIESNTITVSGITGATTISISDGSYAINGATYKTTTGTVNNGDQVTVKLTSTDTYSTATETVLMIGGVNATFKVTTLDDTTPNLFTFTNKSNVPLSTIFTSEIITISGITGPTPITITGGSYSINGGNYSASTGSINNNDTITIRLTSADTYLTSMESRLTIGGMYSTFSVTTIEDPTQNVLALIDQTGVQLNTVIESNAITVLGKSGAQPISISNGGSYAINGGSYTSALGSVEAGDSVVVRLTSLNTYLATKHVTLTIGGIQGTFSVTTHNKFNFADKTNVAVSTVIESNPITVSWVSAPKAISIDRGSYSINGSAYTTTIGIIKAGDSVKVRLTSSSDFAKTTEAVLTIGDISKTSFKVTTRADTTPDTFTLADKNGVPLATIIESGAITVSGISTAVPISINAGRYAINGGAYTSVWGKVSEGDIIRVALTSPKTPSSTKSALLTIGNTEATFTVTTLDDTTPNSFTLVDKSGVPLNVMVESEAITVTSISVPVLVSITGGSYSINGGNYTTGIKRVSDGDQIKLRLTSPPDYSTVTNAVLTIGGISDTFSVTTVDEISPDPFTFLGQTGVALGVSVESQAITVSGISVPVAISISNGSYSINGGNYTAAFGTINNGDRVTVRLTSSKNHSTTTDATLTIGSINNRFSVTTIDDTTPDAFILLDSVGVALNSVIESNPITVSGFSVPLAIYVLDGSYTINGGSEMTSAGSVNPGDIVRVRQTSSAEHSVVTTALLSIGGVGATFNVTTLDNPLQQLSSDYSEVNHKVQINNGQVTWVEIRSSFAFPTTYHLYYYNHETKTTERLPITEDQIFNPQIHNGKIVWNGGDGNGFGYSDPSNIFMYDVTTRTKTQISDDSLGNYSPQIHDNLVVWKRGKINSYRIILYDHTTGKTRQIADNGYANTTISINNGQIVWNGWDGNDSEIFFYDAATTITTQLTDDELINSHQQINNGQVVWKNDKNSIYLYDNSTELTTRLTDDSPGAPQIQDNQVIWVRSGGVLILYDNTTKTTVQLSNNATAPIAMPRIHSGQVIWIQNNNIFIYDSSTQVTTKLPSITIDFPRNGEFRLDSGQIVWVENDANDRDKTKIFLYNNSSQ